MRTNNYLQIQFTGQLIQKINKPLLCIWMKRNINFVNT